jgi:branched-chain amino acid transport system substrate-binding protein
MSSRRIWLTIPFIVIILGALLYRALNTLLNPQTPIYVAVVVPPGADGDDAYNGALLFANQYNDQFGGVNGSPIELIRLNDENSADVAADVARQIASDDRALVVLAHAQSPTSLAASPIYKEAGIPAITGSATNETITLENEWYFRVLPNSLSQSHFVADYAYNIMGYREAAVVYDVDSFGSSLAVPFDQHFKELGGAVHYYLSYDPDDTATPLADQFDQIISTLAAGASGAPGIVYFAGRAPDGANWIVAMREARQDFTVIGPSSFTNIDFIPTFEAYENEALIPGYYSDGVLAVAPVVFDVAGETGQEFFNAFQSAFGVEPGMKAATNYDAMLVAVHAMEQTGITGDPDQRAEERLKIRDYMADIDSISEAVDGVTGLIFFDQNRDVLKPVNIAEYRGQQLISALVQLQPVLNASRYTSAELDEEVNAGRMLRINSQYHHLTHVIYTGIDMIEISNLDLVEDAITLDFYIWFRHQGNVNAAEIVFINGLGDVALGSPIADEVIGGYTYQAYRVKGTFVNEFQFQPYPFDTQTLVVRFRHAGETRSRLIYVRDDVGMQGATSDSILERFENSQVFEISGWEPVQALIFQDIARNDSTLGNPRFFGANQDIEYSRFNMEISIKRDVLSFSIKNLLPLLILLIFSYSVFFIPVSEFSTTNGIIRGVLLTVAFFHLKLSSDLPGVDYLVALDYVFYMLYILFVIELIFSMMMRARKEDEVYVRRLFVIGRVTYPLAILICGVILYLQYFPPT